MKDVKIAARTNSNSASPQLVRTPSKATTVHRLRQKSFEVGEAVSLLLGEFARQDAKWGTQNHPDGTGSMRWNIKANVARKLCDKAYESGKVTWRHILYEEVCEALAESGESLKEELVQVAAVALQWVMDIERRQLCAELEGDRRPGNADATIYKRKPRKKNK